MSLTRIRGGTGHDSPTEWNQEVRAVGSTITDYPKNGDLLATGLTGSYDKKGAVALRWRGEVTVDRDTYPGRILVVGMANAPKTYTE